MVYLFLADGFEIIEALAPVDMLRRAKLCVKTVGVTGKLVTSSCGVAVEADIEASDFSYDNVEAIILPGGSDGVINLEKDSFVQSVIDRAMDEDALICAICAAPSILGNKGMLKDIKATSYPSYMKYLDGAELSDEFVIRDGRFITARGAGVSVEFGLEIVKALAGREEAERIGKAIQCK